MRVCSKLLIETLGSNAWTTLWKTNFGLLLHCWIDEFASWQYCFALCCCLGMKRDRRSFCGFESWNGDIVEFDCVEKASRVCATTFATLLVNLIALAVHKAFFWRLSVRKWLRPSNMRFWFDGVQCTRIVASSSVRGSSDDRSASWKQIF